MWSPLKAQCKVDVYSLAGASEPPFVFEVKGTKAFLVDTDPRTGDCLLLESLPPTPFASFQQP